MALVILESDEGVVHDIFVQVGEGNTDWDQVFHGMAVGSCDEFRAWKRVGRLFQRRGGLWFAIRALDFMIAIDVGHLNSLAVDGLQLQVGIGRRLNHQVGIRPVGARGDCDHIVIFFDVQAWSPPRSASSQAAPAARELAWTPGRLWRTLLRRQ